MNKDEIRELVKLILSNASERQQKVLAGANIDERMDYLTLAVQIADQMKKDNIDFESAFQLKNIKK